MATRWLVYAVFLYAKRALCQDDLVLMQLQSENVENGGVSKTLVDRATLQRGKQLALRVWSQVYNISRTRRAGPAVDANETVRAAVAHLAKVRQGESKLCGRENGTEKAKFATYLGLAVDVLTLLVDRLMPQCPTAFAVMTWWIMGIYVMMCDQALSFVDSIFMLGQQVTTVGYGTHTPSAPLIQVWHAMHMVVAGLMIAPPSNALVENTATQLTVWLTKLTKAEGQAAHMIFEQIKETEVLLWVVVSTVCMWLDLKRYDKDISFGSAFYVVLATMTTAGYGDLAPTSAVAKAMSVPWMMFGVPLYAWGTDSEKTLDEATAGSAGAHRATASFLHEAKLQLQHPDECTLFNIYHAPPKE